MTDTAKPTLQAVLRARLIEEDLSEVVDTLASACWRISTALRRGALDGISTPVNSTNPHGEVQKPLDLLAHRIVVDGLGRCHPVSEAWSEEVEDPIRLRPARPGTFVVAFDPLDGSSNLDVDLSVGTIFSISRVSDKAPARSLPGGRATLCAGYAIYGPSTMFVLCLEGRVDGFTLDEAEDAFILTHPDLRIPPETNEFAINASRQRHWDPSLASYIGDCIAGKEGPRGKDFNMRWTASMVADVHRILMRGGVFLYPLDAGNRALGGHLRLMYEAIPMAMIVEAAGGSATDGLADILDIVPEHLHQRVPVALGSRAEVNRIAQTLRAGGACATGTTA